MAENEYLSSLSQFGFTPVGAAFCVGTWNNYAVALQRFSGRAYYVYLAIRIQKSQAKALKKALNAAVKATGVKVGGVDRVMPNFLHASFSFSKTEDPASRFANWMNTLTAALRANGVYPANTCAVTGAANPDALCLLTNPNFFGYQPVCSSAVRQSGYETQTRAEQNEASGSYLTGFVGALLGALVGIAINLVSILFADLMVAALFALIPIGAMFGYKLFKGKTDKVSIIIIVALCVAAIPVIVLLEIAYALMHNLGLALGDALGYAMELITDGEFLSSITRDLLMMILFMGLGVLFAWRYLSSQLNSTQLQSARLQLDTMRPNPLCQSFDNSAN